MRTTYDAIIIGAGPAGSTAAIRLAQAGWAVALIEKQRFPRRKVCGECLAASNLPLLDALGIGRLFHALAGPELKRVVLMHGREAICADLPPYPGRRHAWGRALGREHLDALLLQRAVEAGATLLQPWTVRAVKGQAGAYQCTAQAFGSRMNVHLNAPLVIAAHGSWEPGLANDRGRKIQAGGRDLFAFKANFAGAQLEEGLLPVLAFKGGYGGMVIGEHGLLTLACCIRRDRLSACRSQIKSDSAGDAVQSYLASECKGVRQALDGAARQGKWLSVGPIRPGIRMPRDGGRFFLVGNAAGEAHPIIGEGMSMAIQSAWLACELLIAEPAALRDARLQRKLMRDYAHAWHAHFARRMQLAAAFAHVAMRPNMARMLLPVLRTWPGVMTKAACWSGKVSQTCCTPQQAPAAPPSTPVEERRFNEISNGENA
ncbi:NAD(P)/FAD-dependent oxidoreductase [Oxalobacteraceae bacterium R-40]|uniref:NAD(P)/FAD-dependent oxidoreductase n=1 Tax=Keguizhuia sedimenti TaxID=3064264 RepID=A0ABU1BJS2_9BURK|nr:NAD(P)/FAD-dependent oxidoreductase [Oxalobacteraceae bacterium R-40]